MKRKYICTIGPFTEKRRDVNLIHQAIGCVLPRDYGKWVYEVAPGVYQVENEEQRAARLNKDQP